MGKLVFEELSAKGLVNRDTFGKSDPYVEVTLMGVMQKTEVIDGVLDPVWREQRTKWKGWEVDPSAGGEIVFAVWDDDTAGRDFLGRAAVDLRSVVPRYQRASTNTVEVVSEQWALQDGVRLGPGDDKKLMKKNSLGTVHFLFKYTELPATTDPLQSSISRSSISERTPTISASMTGPLRLSFKQLRCEDLIPQDVGNTSDPYLVLKIDGVEKNRTEKVMSTLSPTFADATSWTVPLDGGFYPKLEFYLWDHDRVSGDDFLGYGEKQLLPADVNIGAVTTLTVGLRVRPGQQKDLSLLSKQKNVQRKSEQSLGVLHATVLIEGDPRQMAQLRVPAGSEMMAQPALYNRFNSSLRVTLLKAIGLMPDVDPYVEINIENDRGINISQKIVTTKVDASTKNGSNPVWNHEYVRKEDAGDIAKVTFQVRDSKLFGDGYIGRAELIIPKGRPATDNRLVLPLTPRPGRDEAEDRKILSKANRNHFGELVIMFQYEVTDAAVNTPLMMETSKATGLGERHKLQVYVDHAERLLWKDENIATTLQIGKHVMNTPQSSKQNGNYVEVRHTFEADVDRDFLHSTLSLFSTGLTGKDCIGVAPLQIDLRKRPTAPVSLSVELLPGDVPTALNRLNKVEAEDPTQPASLGHITLSYMLTNVDQQQPADTIALMGSARGFSPHPQAQQQQQQHIDHNPYYPPQQSDTPGGYRTSEQPLYEPSQAMMPRSQHGGDDLRFEIERAEGLPRRSHQDCPNVYVIVKREGSGEEFKTCVVYGSSEPKWQFGCDFAGVDAQEVVVVTVFDLDDAGQGYDVFLGEARVPMSELVDVTYGSPDVGAQFRKSSRILMNRTGADGGTCDELRAGGGSKIFFKWKLKRQQDKARVHSKIQKPSVLDVTIHKGVELSSTAHNVQKYAKITLNDSDERRTAKTHDARWDQEFQYSITHEMNTVRISLWEDSQYSRFLGEATLELTATGYGIGQQTIELQPRHDSHYNSDDVKLLNSKPSGLGALEISWNFRTHHAKRQFPTEPYTVILNLLEAAEVNYSAAHYLKVHVKSDPAHVKCSQLERGADPKFRTQFEFTLSHDYDEIVMKLLQRDVNQHGQDEVVADLTFPVGPTQSEASATEKTWCDMVPVANSHVVPRVLFMWKAIVDPSSKQRMLRSQRGAPPHHTTSNYIDQAFTSSTSTCNEYDGGGGGGGYNNYYPQTPAQTPTPPSRPRVFDQDDAVRGVDPREYQALVQQVERLVVQNKSLMAEVAQLRGGGSIPRQQRQQQLGLTVEHAETRRRIFTTVQLPTDAGKVIEAGKRELDLPSGEYILKWRGVEVRNDDTLLGLNDGDMVQLCRGDRFLSRRSPKYGRWTQPHRSPPPARRSPVLHPVNNLVLNRLQRAARSAQEHLTVAFWSAADDDRTAVTVCCDSGFSGFSRPHPVKPGHTEVVIQGPAVDLVPLIHNVADRYAQAGLEVEVVEVKGYIPLLTTTFRSTNDYDEGARMWEACCRPANIPGAGMKAWFYRSTDGIGEGMQGIIVIDERA